MRFIPKGNWTIASNTLLVGSILPIEVKQIKLVVLSKISKIFGEGH